MFFRDTKEAQSKSLDGGAKKWDETLHAKKKGRKKTGELWGFLPKGEKRPGGTVQEGELVFDAWCILGLAVPHLVLDSTMAFVSCPSSSLYSYSNASPGSLVPSSSKSSRSKPHLPPRSPLFGYPQGAHLLYSWPKLTLSPPSLPTGLRPPLLTTSMFPIRV